MSKKEKLFKDNWRRVQRDLKIEVQFDASISLASREPLQVPVWVPQFGARNGMIVVPEFGMIEDRLEELGDSGYGYSVLGYPSASGGDCVESTIRMLSDWGWSGKAEDRPEWLIEM